MPGLEGDKGQNINGPTLIKVPNWIPDALGHYYLYFAHHNGDYIRLAYSEKIEGPYTIYRPGTLHIKQSLFHHEHIASPEILINEDQHKIWMYFHTNNPGKAIYSDQSQMTYLATSENGIKFDRMKQQLAPFYLRIFHYNGYFYGIVKNGNIDGMVVRSKSGITIFERGPHLLPNWRHCGLLVKDNMLYVVFTIVGDSPERIYISCIQLDLDWNNWKLGKIQELIRPETDWEGASLPLTKSKFGATEKSNALRDPFLFRENSEIYLLYSIMGENGIGIAKIYDF